MYFSCFLRNSTFDIQQPSQALLGIKKTNETTRKFKDRTLLLNV